MDQLANFGTPKFCLTRTELTGKNNLIWFFYGWPKKVTHIASTTKIDDFVCSLKIVLHKFQSSPYILMGLIGKS